jgi:hypothetical protein
MFFSFSKFRKKIERSKKEEQEFGPGKKNIAICTKCEAVYYYKSWHHKLEDYRHFSLDKSISFVLCPACQMIEDNKFEGQVIIENVPEEYNNDVVRNIENTGARAFERDPMDRIINVKCQMSQPKADPPRAENVKCYNIEVLTTENQLARNIAKQVERAYKGAKANVSWSKEESAARIIIRFKI